MYTNLQTKKQMKIANINIDNHDNKKTNSRKNISSMLYFSFSITIVTK